MAKNKKDFKPKARKPRGFSDRLGAEIVAEREMLARITAVYEQFGFDPLETPALEYTDAMGKFLPDVERPNQGVFSLTDDDAQWMSLRYDLTAPLARFVAEHYDHLPKPFRRYAVGSVWRNEKPGPGRFRQFIQCDADTVGAPAPHADAEACMMLDAAMQAAGLKPDAYQIRLNDRNILTGLLERIGIDEQRDAEKKLCVLRAMDKVDRLGTEGVALLLGEGRKDESGDYTKGAGLGEEDIQKVLAFMSATGATNAATCEAVGKLIAGSKAGEQGVETLSHIVSQCAALGLSEERIKIDFSVIRGLEYYTGPVFEVELISALTDKKGRPVRFGSVASGGRYDGLVKRFKGIEVPAVGVSVGVSRLLAALALTQKEQAVASGPVVILALEAGQMPAYQQMAAQLRMHDIRAEVYVGGAGMRAQLKYADKRHAPIVIIQGEDERTAGQVTVKDLVLGAQMAQNIDDNKVWRESQPAQRTIARAELVACVQQILAKYL